MSDAPAIAARQVYVYGSARRSETYIYLPARDAFAELPAALRATLGELRFIIEFELAPERKLARSDGATVLRAIADRGFYLQLAPHKTPEHVAPH